MEARLAKMRITGLKYDSGTIHTDNLELDFTIPNSIPGHAAYILRNAGGKGVFLQSLFQLLDPLTSWKGGKNKVSHFFFNNEDRPMKYTFHVVQEWNISKMKRVVLGIAITPQLSKREPKTEFRSPIELDYVLYTKELTPVDDFGIFDLPLWNESEKEALSLDEWKEMLKEDKTFTLYSKYEKEAYLEKIEEYGCNENTVSILKSINVSEGGFGNFFDGATDNTGLFYKLLIPTLNDKIEGIDSHNRGEVSVVSVSFLDTLKIAKELPDLLTMIDRIEQINDFILPLKERFKEGEVIKESLELWKGKGSELLQLLSHLLDSKESQVLRIQKEQDKRKQHLEMVYWKFQNVDYVALHQERDNLDGQYFEMEHEQMKGDLALRDNEMNVINAKVNLEIKRRENKLEEMESNKHSISSLLKSEDVRKTSQGIEEIKAYFEKHWDSIYSSWEKELNRNHRSSMAHEFKLKKLSDDIEAERNQLYELNYKVRFLTSAIEKFEKEMREACQKYGTELTYLISDIIEETRMELTEVKLALENALGKQIKIEEVILAKKVAIGKIKYQMDALSKKMNEVEKNSSLLQKKESQIVAEASKILKTYFPNDMDREGYHQIKGKLQQHLWSIKEKYKEQLRKKWSLQEDVYLIEEGDNIGTYIANTDLVKVKKLLDANQIESMYGTEYLTNLSPDEVQYEIDRNPALRYSIVVLEEEFDSLNLSFIEEELIRSHVVLLDKTKSSRKDKQTTSNPYLDKQDEMNYLFKDRSYAFIRDKYEFNQWKVMIEKKADDIEHQLDSSEKAIEQIENVLKQIELMISGMLKIELAQELQILQNEEKRQKIFISETKVQLEEKEKELKECSLYIKSLHEQQDKINQKEEELVALQKEQKLNKENERAKTRFNTQIEGLNHNISGLEDEKNIISTQNINNKGSFEAWLKYVRKNYSALKGMLGDIQMPIVTVNQMFDEEQDLRVHTYHHALPKEAFERLLTYEELDRDLSNKNIRLAELKVSAKTLQEKVIVHEKTLQELFGDSWRQVQVPEYDEMHLVSIVSQSERLVNDCQSKVNNIIKNMDFNRRELEKIEIQLEEKKKELDKDFPDKGAKYVQIIDCKATKEKYRKERISLKGEYDEAALEISKISRSIEDIKNTIRFLSSFKLSSKEKYMSSLTEEEKINILESPMVYFTKWNHEYSGAITNDQEFKEKLGKRINQIKDKIESFTNIPGTYQNELVHFLSTIRDMSFDEAVGSLNNYLEWAKHNLQDELSQKEKADTAINLWVERTSKRVLQIVQALQDIVRKMTIINWAGERFPLIKYNRNFPFPNDLEDIKPFVKEFCLNEIENYVNKYKSGLDDLTVQDIIKTVNISKIVLKAMGDFPKLLIHIPGIEGALLRGESKKANYKEWETINHGSVTSSTKSGGQTLLAQFIVIAMIMRQRVDDKSSLFLVSDNPFGTMSAQELVEATFSLLDLLNIQWLVVAPPITNVTTTSKFPTINTMSIEVQDGRKVITKKLVKNHRKYLENISVLDKPTENDNVS